MYIIISKALLIFTVGIQYSKSKGRQSIYVCLKAVFICFDNSYYSLELDLYTYMLQLMIFTTRKNSKHSL